MGREPALAVAAVGNRRQAQHATHASPPACTLPCRWVVPLLWLPVAALLARRALRAGVAPGPAAACAAAGVLLWQLIEYSLHRWLFHAAPSTPFTILAHFLMHGWAGGRAGGGLVRCLARRARRSGKQLAH